mgnify:CR=1 FL=1
MRISRYVNHTILPRYLIRILSMLIRSPCQFHTSSALHSLLPDHLMLQSCLRPLRHGDLFLFVPVLSCLFKLFVGHNAISILLKFTLLFQKNLIKTCSVYSFKLLRQVFAFRLESMPYGLIIYQFPRFDIIFSDSAVIYEDQPIAPQ